MNTVSDRNFDPLLERFEKQVYGTFKGNWRLRLLKQDLDDFYHSETPLSIWDAGCGFAQISLWLALKGHQVSACDLSARMLERARAKFAEHQITAQFQQGPAQELADDLPEFDLVLCHALLEWLAHPLESLQKIVFKVKPGGALSLLFYNRNALVYSNVLKGKWRWQHILDDAYIGVGKKLTPPHPLYPHEVEAQLQDWGFHVTRHTGIRVFHDYLRPEVLAEGSQEELMRLETSYCRLPVYRDMGRYVHLLATRV